MQMRGFLKGVNLGGNAEDTFRPMLWGERFFVFHPGLMCTLLASQIYKDENGGLNLC